MAGTASETFYDLAIRAIEEQEWEVNSLRTRTGTIAAAGAVAATILAREVFAGSHGTVWPQSSGLLGRRKKYRQRA